MAQARRIASALLLAMVAAPGQAEDLEVERASVQRRLEDEREGLKALKAESTNVLDALDALERLARVSSSGVAALEERNRRVSKQLALAARLEAEAQEAVSEQLRRLGPRLTTMYRMGRQKRLAVLLSVSDLTSLVRRSQAMQTLVEEDLETLRELKQLMDYQRSMTRRFRVLKASAQEQLQALKAEQSLSQMRRAEFQDLLASVQAESSQARRVIRELEHADRRLGSMISEMNNAMPSSPFRSMKGQLPFPTQGIVEVGFGRIVNPKFNTVVEHKGLDVRAAMGTPVRAISDGKVAYTGWLKGYGNIVIVDHGSGFHSLSAHLVAPVVDVGGAVSAGDIVGHVGDTGSLKGAFLYFEIRFQGQAIDPAPWLREP
jgi:septal ring factor EnvC (AmiA/AmiB activator)